MDQVAQEIKGFIGENYMLDKAELDAINVDTSFLKAGIIDSMGVMELVEFVEDKYEVTFDTEEIIPENLDSLKNITAFISKKRN